MDKVSYILATLRLIEWTDKSTGEAQSCYAYSTSGSTSHKIFGSQTFSSLSIRVAGQRVNSSQSDVTLWLNDMTSAEYDLYVEQGNTQAYIAISGDVASPKDCQVITVAQFQALDNPNMLFATV